MTTKTAKGTVTRDSAGRFQKTYTLGYKMAHPTTGTVTRVIKHVPADRMRRFAPVISRMGDRGQAWGIFVLDTKGDVYDADHDVTDEFACFT